MLNGYESPNNAQLRVFGALGLATHEDGKDIPKS